MITRRTTCVALAGALLGAFALTHGTASAQLASCADLLYHPPLAGNPAVFSATSVQQTTAGRAYCMVNVVWRDPAMRGSAAGYADPYPAVDSYQHIRIGIALPLNTSAGDAAWGGRLIMTAGGGAQGSVPALTGMIQMNPAAMGAGTDSGHGTADSGSGDSWGVIQGVSVNFGKLEDWAGGRSNGIAVKLAKQLAKTYYGADVRRTYWQGRSGGGHMGWAQMQNFAKEYDGAVIGAAANHWQKFRLAFGWDEIVQKKVAQQTSALTVGQLNAANAAATAACLGQRGGSGGVIVGTTPILHDPRACTWSARNNICGEPNAPAAPDCLNEIQAAGIDAIWDGPRNSKGKRIWHAFGRGINLGATTTTPGATDQVLQWSVFDNSFSGANLYQDQESIDLAAAAGADVSRALTYEDAAVLVSRNSADYADTDDPKLDGARNGGIKIIAYHGTQDQLIHFANSIDYYRRVTTYFGNGKANFERLRDWYRLFLIPNTPHQADPAGFALSALIDWVENGVAPESLGALNQQNLVSIPKLCPFPQYAIYDGFGSTSDAANYTCGGNLDANPVALCTMPRVKVKQEKGAALNTSETAIPPGFCRGRDHDDDDDDDDDGNRRKKHHEHHDRDD